MRRLSPARRGRGIDQVRQELDVSERRACRVTGQHRSMQRRAPHGRADEDKLVTDWIEFASQYGRHLLRPDPCHHRGRVPHQSRNP